MNVLSTQTGSAAQLPQACKSTIAIGGSSGTINSGAATNTTTVAASAASPMSRQYLTVGISRLDANRASRPRNSRKLAGKASSIARSKSIAASPRAIDDKTHTANPVNRPRRSELAARRLDPIRGARGESAGQVVEWRFADLLDFPRPPVR